mmetsp:Transcript_23072/g.76516  ORF Transcript_23072/g.76516 Transcript_23072/m.76516 type:complete len:264 (+) Transcript_23072:358-1149(+)
MYFVANCGYVHYNMESTLSSECSLTLIRRIPPPPVLGPSPAQRDATVGWPRQSPYSNRCSALRIRSSPYAALPSLPEHWLLPQVSRSRANASPKSRSASLRPCHPASPCVPCDPWQKTTFEASRRIAACILATSGTSSARGRKNRERTASIAASGSATKSDSRMRIDHSSYDTRGGRIGGSSAAKTKGKFGPSRSLTMIGMQPAATESYRRREVEVSPLKWRQKIESRISWAYRRTSTRRHRFASSGPQRRDWSNSRTDERRT